MNLKYIKLILLFILIPFLSSAQNNYTSHNSIRIESIYKSGVRSIDSIDFLNHTEKAVGVEYRDGLGRNFYQSAVAASPFKRDISSFSVYNGSQGIDTAYLSFISRTLDGELLSKQNAIEELLSFYAETKNKVVDDAYPFAVMKYDNSPNQRVIEAGKPGYDWQLGQHTRKFKTYTNLANQYKIWKADLTSSAFYVAGTLLIKENLDEDNNITRAIYNNEGQIIEKHQQVDGIIFAKTIYIYNRIGLLKCIIQPEGVNRIGSANTIAQNIIDNFSTHYKYDNKGRLVEKYIAGGGSTFYVYDKADRLVLYQDENSKAKNKWIFTKVDVHGRILMKGFYNSTSTRDALQNQLDSFYSNSSILPYEERLKQGSEVYTNQSFPNQNTELLALYFYDNDYDTNNNQVSDIISSDIELPFRNLIQRNFGTLSASKVKVLGTNNWLTQYNYYDQYGRIIVTKFNTHVQINHFNTVYFEYDNFGNLKSTKKIHKNIDGTLTTLALSYEYDHAKRPINIWHKINDQTEVNVVNFVYNEIGQLVKKNIHFDSSLGNPTSNPEQLHSVDISKSVYATSEKKLIARNEIKLLPGYSANASIGQTLTATIDIESAENALAASYVQSIDYNYTIHGELAGVNRVKDAQDLFAAELFYNNSNENLPITPKWNGAISGIKSSSTGSSHTAEFSAYQYDNANRLKNISYVGKAETGLWNKNTNVFNEKFSYDLNGNITNLIRNTTAYDEASPVPNYKAAHLDSLIFTYNFGNQLKKVNDRSSNQAGFKNTGSSTDDFAYNSAGAITQDKNKGIDSVKYNAFGLIERVKFSSGKSIQYYYDANGSKLSMKMVDGNQTQHTKYVGEFIYRNDTLEFISSPEGRLVQKSNAFKYEYFITDHMGNNRLLFKSDAATENTYTANFET
ncbi:MAG: DUF6443 domain-containing protein, partial [Cyclobacteriaceae bacterium]|nr:DUF6443 domain-containing protein [Cyclobacteriaceae bacterium]